MTPRSPAAVPRCAPARVVRRPRRLAALTGAAALALSGLTAMSPAPAAGAVSTPEWGVYVGAGAKNVAGAPAFAAATGLPISGVVDFLPTTSWSAITGSTWLLTPYRGQPLSLELSVPMLPDGAAPDGRPWNLADCAAGSYDAQWSTLGRALVSAGLPATIVRPGWEFNGNWYRWGAAGKVAEFRGCFQHLVTSMRAVTGSRFRFDWNPNLGAGTFPAEQAYPGDAYVDVVGVDVYDLSWTWYPVPAGVTVTKARESAWAWIERGDHGLAFWSAFARSHAKPLSLTEWGVTRRPDGHGGGDNPYFVDRMMNFITDPANGVARSQYFNIDTASVQHDLTRAGTLFPTAATGLRARALLLAGTAPVDAGPSPAIAPATSAPAATPAAPAPAAAKNAPNTAATQRAAAARKAAARKAAAQARKRARHRAAARRAARRAAARRS